MASRTTPARCVSGRARRSSMVKTMSWVASSGNMRSIAPRAQARLGRLRVDAGVPLAGLGRVAALLQRAAHPDHLARATRPGRRRCMAAAARLVSGPSATMVISPGCRLDVRAQVARRRDGRVLGAPQLAVLAAQLDVAGAGRPVRVRRGAQPALQRSRGADADRHVGRAPPSAGSCRCCAPRGGSPRCPPRRSRRAGSAPGRWRR